MSQSQRRATALTNEQIAYIKGCAKLQLSIWRLCHRDPLKALSERMSQLILRQAILTLMGVRERLRKQYLRSNLQKWSKLAKMMTFSNSKRETLLRGRINSLEALKKFILSQNIKNWRIKAARSGENYLSRIGAFMKLMEAGIKKKTKPTKKEFLQKMRKTIAPEYYQRPLKGCLKLYDRCQKLLKNRFINNWRNKVRDWNNLLFKRQLSLKNIVKPLVANNTVVLKNILNTWRHNALGIKNDYDRLELLRGHAAYSLYNKWNKTNMLKILSTAFNEWRRRAAIKPTNYKRRIIEAKPHMLKHNINMNAEDLLTGLRNQYNRKLRKDKLKKIVNKSDRSKLGLLDKAFQKWSKKTDIISLLKSKLISILRSRVNKIDLVRKIVLKDALKKMAIKNQKK